MRLRHKSIHAFLSTSLIVLYLVARTGLWNRAESYRQALNVVYRLFVGFALVAFFFPAWATQSDDMASRYAFAAGSILLLSTTLADLRQVVATFVAMPTHLVADVNILRQDAQTSTPPA